MKKVIVHGWDKFAMSCEKCGCTFVYELSDTKYNRVTCPECEWENRHETKNEITSEVFDVYMADNYQVKNRIEL